MILRIHIPVENAAYMYTHGCGHLRCHTVVQTHQPASMVAQEPQPDSTVEKHHAANLVAQTDQSASVQGFQPAHVAQTCSVEDEASFDEEVAAWALQTFRNSPKGQAKKWEAVLRRIVAGEPNFQLQKNGAQGEILDEVMTEDTARLQPGLESQDEQEPVSELEAVQVISQIEDAKVSKFDPVLFNCTLSMSAGNARGLNEQGQRSEYQKDSTQIEFCISNPLVLGACDQQVEPHACMQLCLALLDQTSLPSCMARLRLHPSPAVNAAASALCMRWLRMAKRADELAKEAIEVKEQERICERWDRHDAAVQ